jgi:hypothetical protein
VPGCFWRCAWDQGPRAVFWGGQGGRIGYEFWDARRVRECASWSEDASLVCESAVECGVYLPARDWYSQCAGARAVYT